MVETNGTNLTDVDWATLPRPEDDGSAERLTGQQVPDVALPATDHTQVRLAGLKGLTVLYCYPMTGTPGQALPDGWNDIPGARGCTPQSCAFRDHFEQLRTAGASHVYGLSTQATREQAEAVQRLHLPFALLSDANMKFTEALELPTFEVEGKFCINRITFVFNDARIIKVFYPVFPPDQNPHDVIRYLQGIQ